MIPKLGTTFSLPYTAWLQTKIGKQVGWRPWLNQILELGIDTVRLPVEWNEIETGPGVYDQQKLTEIRSVIECCRQKKVSVILCLGIKVPRWPEVHLPLFYVASAKKDDQKFRSALLNYLQLMLDQFGNDPTVTIIQLENEPLEAFGQPRLTVPIDLLRQEVALARELLPSGKTIAITFGAGLTDSNITQMTRRRQGILKPLLDLDIDQVGINLYQQGITSRWLLTDRRFTASPAEWNLARQFTQEVRTAGKQPFIAELQFEPWEAEPNKMNFTDPFGNHSLNPSDCIDNFERASRFTECDLILLWGLEFQLACAAVGNSAWLETTQQICLKNS